MFRVNYFIVSQCNPHILPFLNQNWEDMDNQFTYTESFSMKLIDLLDSMGSHTVNHQLNRLVKLKAIPAVYGQHMNNFITQTFTGDITIMPKISMQTRFKVLKHPTKDDMRQYISIGEKACWKHLNHIKDMIRIEKLIDHVIQKLKHDTINKNGSISSNKLDSDDDDDDDI